MANKTKYLKIVKPDNSVHFAPLTAKKKLSKQNEARSKKYVITEVELTDDELANHPSHEVTERNAEYDVTAKAYKKAAETALKEKEELEKRIEELEAKNLSIPKAKAADVIAMINAAETIEEVEELIEDDTRNTVLKAAEAKKAELASKE